MPFIEDEKLITQTERLLTVRPRSAAMPIQRGGAGNRGTRASIKLLSSNPGQSQTNKRAKASESGFSSTGISDYITSKLLNKAGSGFTDFLLTSVQVAFNEKVQITQTFGDAETVYYFGKQPVIFNLGGVLIDDLDNQWFTIFVETYCHVLRGTELARNHELVEIVLPNMIVIGSVMSFGYNQDSARDTDIPFTMQVHAKQVVPLPVQIPTNAFSPEFVLFNAKKAELFSEFNTMAKIEDLKRMQAAAQAMAREELEDAIARGEGPTTGAGNPGILSNGKLPNTTSIAAFKASLFSPVFGVLTTITKVVKDVTGDISKIISSFTSPVNTVLRDIQGISAQAVAVARLVENSINTVVNVPLKTLNEVRNTIVSLRNTAGVISRLPETVSQSIRRLTRFGSLRTTAAFLTKGGSKPSSKAALLNSGAPYTLRSGATIRR